MRIGYASELRARGFSWTVALWLAGLTARDVAQAVETCRWCGRSVAECSGWECGGKEVRDAIR